MSNKVKVCLDAGHVGSKYNQSPVVKTYYESAMVWSLHLKLKAALEARGFEVVTTRKTIDTKMDVYDRGTASKGCDVFLSLHSNACAVSFNSFMLLFLLDIKFELLRRLRRHRYHPKISQPLQRHGRGLFEALEVRVRDIRFQNDRHHIAYNFHTGRMTSSASSPME